MTEHLGSAATTPTADSGHGEHYVLLYSPGPAWVAGLPVTEQALGPHHAYAQALFDAGRLAFAGLAAAVTGVDVIVHAATSPYRRSRQIDVDGTRRLLDAARAAAVPHFVYISIVGVDRIPLPYYRRKLSAERLVVAGSVAWSIVRATQFFPFVDLALAAAARLPVMLLPTDLLGQAVDTGEVAARIAAMVGAGPGGYLPEIGGPEVLSVGAAARQWLSTRRWRRKIVHVPLPGAVARGFRRGDHTTRQTPVGRVTWAEWLARRYPRPP